MLTNWRVNAKIKVLIMDNNEKFCEERNKFHWLFMSLQMPQTKRWVTFIFSSFVGLIEFEFARMFLHNLSGNKVTR